MRTAGRTTTTAKVTFMDEEFGPALTLGNGARLIDRRHLGVVYGRSARAGPAHHSPADFFVCVFGACGPFGVKAKPRRAESGVRVFAAPRPRLS